MTTKQEAQSAYSKFICDCMELNIELLTVYKRFEHNPRYANIIKNFNDELIPFTGLLMERQHDMSVENIHKINNQKHKKIAAYNILVAAITQ